MSEKNNEKKDCKKIEDLIMRHFDKTIKPENAGELAKHVLICEDCRELYLTLDEAMEMADGGELAAAPVNFTESVMAAVRAEAPYTKPIAEPKPSVALRVIWVGGALLFSVCLMFIINPDALYALAEVSSVFDTVLNAFYSIGIFVGDLAERAIQSDGTLSADNLSVGALLLLAVMGTLLYVLHSGEKAEA